MAPALAVVMALAGCASDEPAPTPETHVRLTCRERHADVDMQLDLWPGA